MSSNRASSQAPSPKGLVLIADSDAARGRRIAAACGARGYECRVTTQGAGALEIALAETPDATIAELGLPLIDGVRLAEILRANPRTENMGILYVGERSGGGSGARPGGRFVSPHADPDTIATFLEAVLAKRKTGRPLPREEDAGGVEGQLTQIALAELLELFHANRRSGVVELRRHATESGGEVGRVLLHEGDVVHASVGAVEGEKALYRLFGWDRGRFTFRAEPVQEGRRIERPTRALLREGRRQAEEWERLAEALPADHARVSRTATSKPLPSDVHPLTREVLDLVSDGARVSEVLDHSSYPDYQILRTLHTLIRQGTIAVEREAEPSDEDSSAVRAPGLFSEAEANRLRGWVAGLRPRSGAPAHAKVVVIGAQPEAARSFTALLERLPEAQIAAPPAMAAAALLGRIAIDDELALEFTEVDASERCAPLWPLAAHAALAVLLIHAGSIDQGVPAARRVREAVSAFPDARILHIELLEKDAPDERAALCERLALPDDRCVVSLPLDPPERALAAVRALLTRLLP